jgi:hypothetical protein
LKERVAEVFLTFIFCAKGRLGEVDTWADRKDVEQDDDEEQEEEDDEVEEEDDDEEEEDENGVKQADETVVAVEWVSIDDFTRIIF